jgi:hypothetical protein
MEGDERMKPKYGQEWIYYGPYTSAIERHQKVKLLKDDENHVDFLLEYEGYGPNNGRHIASKEWIIENFKPCNPLWKVLNG